MGTKGIFFLGILILFMASVCLGEAGDMKLTNNLCLKPGKDIKFYYDTEDYQYVDIESLWSDILGRGVFKIPCLAYGNGNFLSTDSDGVLVFLSTAPYYGDITSVWTDDNGDVSALTAASDDTLNAAAAGSTIPWKVSTTANPTTEGMAVWDSDDDRLAIGDGTSTYYIQLDGNLTIESASNVNQDLTTDASVTFNDITVSTPSNIYSLDHDSFSGFDENEHIDWTNATSNLLTTGTGTFENVHIASGETYDTILEADNTELAADRTIIFRTNNADRAITLEGSPTLDDWFNQGVKSTDSPTFDNPILTGLTFDWTDDYLITKRTGDYLAIQCQTSNVDSIVELYTKDGDQDAGENVLFQIFAKGTPSDVSVREAMGIGYLTADTRFAIFTGYAGEGAANHPIAIYTQGNTDQLLLATNGNCSMSGSLTAAGLTLDFTQDYLFTQRGGSTLAIQGQTSAQTSELELYTADGDGTDDICLTLFAAGSPSDLTDSEYLRVGLDQSESYWQVYSAKSDSGTLYPINMFTYGNLNQLVLGTDGSCSMSGALAVTGTIGGATGSTFGTLTLANGSITDSGGAISFNDENLSTSGNITTTAGSLIAGKLEGYGDADTYWQLAADTHQFYSGGVKLLNMAESAFGNTVTVNPDKTNTDFRVEGDTNSFLLLCDAENEKVGIGDGAPGEKLDVAGNINCTGVYKVGDDDGVSGTLELDDGTTEKITLVFTGGILTSRTVAATTGSALCDWTD